MPIEYEKKNETLGGCLKSKKVLYRSIYCQSTKIEKSPFCLWQITFITNLRKK